MVVYCALSCFNWLYAVSETAAAAFASSSLSKSPGRAMWRASCASNSFSAMRAAENIGYFTTSKKPSFWSSDSLLSRASTFDFNWS